MMFLLFVPLTIFLTMVQKIGYTVRSMLVISGKIHAAFTKGSANVNIRNGVSVLAVPLFSPCRNKKLVFMILQTILKARVVKKLCARMVLFPELMYRNKTGYKPMVILG